MGSYDGLELCELVGVYILPHLETIINKNEMGLYRDDGLLISRIANDQKTNKTRKNIIEIFKNIVFKIDIATNLKEVHFLDATFNLTNGTFRPYKKSKRNCCISTPYPTILQKLSSNFPRNQ